MSRSPSRRSLWALDGLNIFLADVGDGVGPFLAIYLSSTLFGMGDRVYWISLCSSQGRRWPWLLG